MSGFINPLFRGETFTSNASITLTGPLPAGSNQIGTVVLANNPLPGGGNQIGIVDLAAGASVSINSPVTLANPAVSITNTPSVSALGRDAAGNQHGVLTDGAGALAPTRAVVNETVVSIPAGVSTTILNANTGRWLWKAQTTTNDSVIISESGQTLLNANAVGTLLSGLGSVYAPPLASATAITAYCSNTVSIRMTEYVATTS